MIRSACPLFCIALTISAGVSEVHAARFALLVANNTGWLGEPPLKYTHQDAARISSILLELGGFHTEQVVVLRDASVARIEQELRRMATRVQRRVGEENLFFFYYSGHADEEALHPGLNALRYTRLKALLAIIPASLLISILDSCKSGGLAQLKGAKRGPAFEVLKVTNDRIAGDGIISSTTASENAQESARFQGSFFSNAMATGLRGAADANEDGAVTLTEMYAYAYALTVGLTSGTRAGTQHPTFRFDLRGRGQLILTHPRQASACLLFNPSQQRRHYQVLDARNDALIMEVPPTLCQRTSAGMLLF